MKPKSQMLMAMAYPITHEDEEDERRRSEEGEGDEEEESEEGEGDSGLSAAQKKLPAGLQKAIAAKKGKK